MSKQEHIELDGEIIEAGRGIFRVRCESERGDEHIVLAKLSGKMRKNRIRVVLGDKVTVNVSPYDASRGMITFRKR